MYADNVRGTHLLVSTALLISDAVVCCLCMLSWTVSSREAVKVRPGLFSMTKVLLSCCFIVHKRGGDVIGRCDIFVKTVVLIVFEGFTSITAYSSLLEFPFPQLRSRLRSGDRC